MDVCPSSIGAFHDHPLQLTMLTLEISTSCNESEDRLNWWQFEREWDSIDVYIDTVPLNKCKDCNSTN